jgi:hypothetical protein
LHFACRHLGVWFPPLKLMVCSAKSMSSLTPFKHYRIASFSSVLNEQFEIVEYCAVCMNAM